MYEDFINGRLGSDEWTHNAHLVAGFMSLREREPAEALAHLRDSIRTHNCGVGLANTEHSGYHESITVYYVTAIAALGAERPEDLFDAPSCSSDAPLQHWSRDLLFTPRARLGWVAPDVSPLPWTPVTSPEVGADNR